MLSKLLTLWRLGSKIPMPLAGGYGMLLRLGTIGVVMIGVGVVAWIKGNEHGTAKLTKYLLAEQVNIVTVTKFQNSVTQQFITEYVPREIIIKEKGDEVIREVPTYIREADNSACVIPNGFVLLHNAAAGAGLTGAPAESDRAASPFTLVDVALTVTENYTTCQLYRQRAWGWEEWYARQQKVGRLAK
jgi:hypothetical protein